MEKAAYNHGTLQQTVAEGRNKNWLRSREIPVVSLSMPVLPILKGQLGKLSKMTAMSYARINVTYPLVTSQEGKEKVAPAVAVLAMMWLISRQTAPTRPPSCPASGGRSPAPGQRGFRNSPSEAQLPLGQAKPHAVYDLT